VPENTVAQRGAAQANTPEILYYDAIFASAAFGFKKSKILLAEFVRLHWGKCLVKFDLK